MERTQMFSRRHITAIALLLFAAGIFGTSSVPARAASDWPPLSPEDLSLKDNPAEPGAAAMILYREEIINNKDFHDFYSEHFYRIKIFSDAGKKYADVELPSSKSYEVRDIHGKTIHPDGKVIEFDGKVLDKLLVKAGDLKVQVKTFTLPDVTPGSVIEYTYKVSLPAAYLAPANWPVQDAIYTRRAHFVYRPYTGGTTAMLLWRASHLDNIKPPKHENDGSWSMDVADMPGLPEESNMLPLNEVRGRIEFYYTNERHTADAKQYWDNIAKIWADENEKFIGKRGSIRDVVQQVTASSDSPESKLRKLYARAQAIHNFDYDPEKSLQEAEREKAKKDANVDDVLKRGSANSLNINQFFVALAQAAGFDASITWVRGRNNSFFHPEMQDHHELNASLVWVRAGDKDFYLDPGNPFCPFDMLPWYETFTTTLRPTKQGAVFTETPLPPAAQSTTYRIAQFTLDPEGSLSGMLTVRFTGQAAFIRRMDNRDQDETGRKKLITDEIKAWFPPSTTFELTSLSGWDKNGDPLEAQGKLTMPNIATVAGRRILLQVTAYTGGTRQRFDSTKRQQDIYFPYPSAASDDFTIQFPASMQMATIPKPNVLNVGAEFHYELSAKQEGSALHVQRKINVNGVLYPVDSYVDIRNFYSLAKADDEQQVVLQAPATGGN
jgi:hypothetical protein